MMLPSGSRLLAGTRLKSIAQLLANVPPVRLVVSSVPHETGRDWGLGYTGREWRVRGTEGWLIERAKMFAINGKKRSAILGTRVSKTLEKRMMASEY